eukprot:g9611.t1
MTTAPGNPFASDPKYFGVGASFPKPTRQHWNQQTDPLIRTASVPVLVDATNGRHVSNELHPPFSRVHYNLDGGRLEDSGYQGRANLLRYSSVTQSCFDRSFRKDLDDKLTKADNPADRMHDRPQKVSLEDYCGKMKRFNDSAVNNQVRETTFDRVIFHSTCVDGNPAKYRDSYPSTFLPKYPTRVLENPLIKTSAGIVGPEKVEHANTSGMQRQRYHP